MSTPLPVLFQGLVHDAAVYPPGSAPLHEAVKAHRRHRSAWYAELIGPLLVPASSAASLGSSGAAGSAASLGSSGAAGSAASLGSSGGSSGAGGSAEDLIDPAEQLAVGLIADTGLAGLGRALASAPRGVVHVEAAVAKRGEDPLPGLIALLEILGRHPDLPGYAEIPLTFGLLSALDAVSDARAAGVHVAAKFRTGGLAAELFPTPIELAAVICACRDRDVPFKLTAGLHHAVRHTDPETGFIHHGFLNIAVATTQAVGGAEVADVGATLAGTDPVPLLEATRHLLDQRRVLWDGYGSCNVGEPVADLARLGLLPGSRP